MSTDSDDSSDSHGDSPKFFRSGSYDPSPTNSGDHVSGVHEYKAYVRDKGTNTSVQIKIPCSFGDAWCHTKTSCTSEENLTTGDDFNDSVLGHLGDIGYHNKFIIDRGKFGCVLLSNYQNNSKDVAIKVLIKNVRRRMRKDTSANGRWSVELPEEIELMAQLDHPNIVKMYDYVSWQGRLCIVMEYCESGNLEQLLRAREAGFLTEPVAKRYLRQLQMAIEYLHGRQVAHRDITTQNILVSARDVIKLCDFGSATRFCDGDHLCTDSVGISGYQPPEVLLKKPYDPKKADLWSMGIVLYKIVTGNLPFGETRIEVISEGGKCVPFPDEKVFPLTQPLKTLLCGILAYSPTVRYSLNRIRNSEWYNMADDVVHIGNFYLVMQPQKISCGVMEKELKLTHGI